MKTFLELLNGILRMAPAILFNSWFFSPWANQLAKAVVKVHERLVLLGRRRVHVKMGWILTSQSTGLWEDIEYLTDEGNKENNSWLPKGVPCFPGGKWTWAKASLVLEERMHCGAHSPGQTTALFSEKLHFFYSTSVLSLFSVLTIPFSTLHTIE